MQRVRSTRRNCCTGKVAYSTSQVEAQGTNRPRGITVHDFTRVVVVICLTRRRKPERDTCSQPWFCPHVAACCYCDSPRRRRVSDGLQRRRHEKKEGRGCDLLPRIVRAVPRTCGGWSPLTPSHAVLAPRRLAEPAHAHAMFTGDDRVSHQVCPSLLVTRVLVKSIHCSAEMLRVHKTRVFIPSLLSRMRLTPVCLCTVPVH